MTKANKELFNEPDCSINKAKDAKEKLKGCSKPVPGKASGGCAFDGAQIVLYPIADCAHIVHGPNLCCSHSYFTRGTRTTFDKPLYNYGFSTDLAETDIIFGAEKKLLNKISYVHEHFKPRAIFVYSTCISAMIGEDLDRICKEAQNTIQIPVIPVDSPGFIGKKNYGNKLAGEALLKHVIGTGKPHNTTKRDICLIGDYNIAGEIWNIMPLFHELGIRVLSKITGDSTFDELTYAHYAKCSVVICSQALLSLARKLKEQFNIPYIQGSFYSMKEIKNTLLNIADALQDEPLRKDILELTKRKEAETYKKFAPYAEKLKDKKVFIYSGGVKSWSFVYLLEELGLEVIGTSTRKSTDEDIEHLKAYFEGKQKILMEQGDGIKILELMQQYNADLLLAGGRNRYTSIKGKYPFVDINQERLHAYSGYEGLIRLAKDIYNEFSCPVFRIARGTF
jgi:nitrogenase molybdenum-cofactor synthesis protein NifE